jgi:hypothetical protein
VLDGNKNVFQSSGIAGVVRAFGGVAGRAIESGDAKRRRYKWTTESETT